MLHSQCDSSVDVHDREEDLEEGSIGKGSIEDMSVINKEEDEYGGPPIDFPLDHMSSPIDYYNLMIIQKKIER